MANVTIQEINSGTAATTVTGTDTIEGQEASGGSSKFFTLTTLKNYFLGIIGVWTKNQSVAPSTLTSGTTVNTDASLSNSFKLGEFYAIEGIKDGAYNNETTFAGMSNNDFLLYRLLLSNTKEKEGLQPVFLNLMEAKKTALKKLKK
mgnify:CR=1 FL=1